jgi:hypothetical protein
MNAFVHVVEDTLEIEAPASVVFEVLTQRDAWARWSTMLVSREPGPITLGATLALGLRTKEASYDFDAVVTELVPGRVFEWLAKTGVTGLMDGRHRFEIIALTAQRSRLRNVERYSGILVPIVRRTASMRAAPAGFRKMNEELRARAEHLASQPT